KVELIFPETTPVTFFIAWVGIQDIIEHDEVRIPEVERIVGRAKIGFVGFISKRISHYIEVHIVVTHQVIPWHTDLADSVDIRTVQYQVVAHQIAQAEAETNIADALQFRYNASGKVFNFLLGISLGVAKHKRSKVQRFVVSPQREVDRLRKLPRGRYARIFQAGRRALGLVNIIERRLFFFINGDRISLRLNH